MAASEGPEVLDLSHADTKRVILEFKQQRNCKEPCYYTTQQVDSHRSFVKIFCRDPAVRRAFAKQINDFLGKGTGVETGKETSQVRGHYAINQRPNAPNREDVREVEPPEVNGAVNLQQEEECQNAATSRLGRPQNHVPANQENGRSERVSAAPNAPIKVPPKLVKDTRDIFTCPVVKENIERPEQSLRDLFLLRPYAAQFLRKSEVHRATALQNAAWPDLLEKKSMVLIGPRGFGKTYAYLPIALTFSVKNTAVILTATDSRITKLSSTLGYLQLPIDVTRPPSKIYNSRKQLLICSLHWFYHNRCKLTPSVVVFDRLDQMVASALDVTCVEVAKSCADIPIIATARSSSPQLDQTLEFMNITSSVMVPTKSHKREFREYLVSIDDAPEHARYFVLLSTLRKESPDEVILIFFADETEVNSMYDKLEEEAIRGNVPFSSFHNLREKLEEERNLLRSFLNEGMAGVYLACLQDHTWLFTTSSVHTVINYRPPDCAQAYRYRRERLLNNGKVLTITRGLDLNVLPEDLFHMLSNLNGHHDRSPRIDVLRKAFEEETKLRNTLRFHLLS